MPEHMILAAPAQSAGELAALREAGAGEVYCGLMEHAWQGRYGSHDSISRRQGLANLQSPEVLAELVREARRLALPVYLTLNARYTPPQYPYLVEVAQKFEALGGTALHVSDLGLMLALKEAGIRLKLSVSLLAVCLNRQTAQLWAGLGARRIVFPRCLSPMEMGQILCSVPGLEGEAMVMGDKCAFIDGLCRCYHGVGYRSGASGQGSRRVIETFDTTFSALACDEWKLRGGGMPCAACRIKDLAAGGVTVGKLGGRGTPLPYRLSMLRFLSKAMTLSDDRERQALYREHFKEGCRCYYEGARP